jgi:hypothetical protein
VTIWRLDAVCWMLFVTSRDTNPKRCAPSASVCSEAKLSVFYGAYNTRQLIDALVTLPPLTSKPQKRRHGPHADFLAPKYLPGWEYPCMRVIAFSGRRSWSI